MSLFRFASFFCSFSPILLLLLFSQTKQASANLDVDNTSTFLQKRQLAVTISLSCDTGSVCTSSISADHTILVELGSSANYMLELLINRGDKDLYIGLESRSSISASLLLTDGPLSTPIYFDVDNGLQQSGTWISDTIISRETLIRNLGSTIAIVLSNPGPQDQIIKVSFNYSGLPAVAIALATIGGTALVCLGLCCCIRHERKRSAANMAQRRLTRAAERSAANKNDTAERQRYLTEEDIDNYFPEVRFEHLKSSFSQSSCSICLEELTKEVECRQLYCEHIFHSECIKMWLKSQIQKKQACCPNCNKDMNDYQSRQ